MVRQLSETKSGDNHGYVVPTGKLEVRAVFEVKNYFLSNFPEPEEPGEPEVRCLGKSGANSPYVKCNARTGGGRKHPKNGWPTHFDHE